MAGWALFGAFLAFTVPQGKVKFDNAKELKELKKIVEDLKSEK
jgi:hypothetical protein